MVCCDNNVLIRLGLSTKTTLLGLRRNSCFGLPGSVAYRIKNIQFGCYKQSWKTSWWLLMVSCLQNAEQRSLAWLTSHPAITPQPSTFYMTRTVEIHFWYVCHIIGRKVKCWLGCCSTATALHYWLFRSIVWSLAQRHFTSFQYIQSIGRHFSQTDGTHMYLKSYFIHLRRAAAVRCKMAAMCGPDCDDVMDDVSNSH